MSPAKHMVFSHILFFLFLFSYLLIGWWLIGHIDYIYPRGGPDEPMHISMAHYIATHLSWPPWDSEEILRSKYGVSYTTGSSIVYWLHGIGYRLFGEYRITAFLLLICYLGISLFAYIKNHLAGLFLLALLFPQTLFVFSYVNSDAGTILSALLLGLATGRFIIKDKSHQNLFLLFFFTGFALTARQHLWPIAFLTFVWVLYYQRTIIASYHAKTWSIAFFLAIIPASWWLVTSYRYNDGDITGFIANAQALSLFSAPDLPPLAKAWSDISLPHFLHTTLKSLYADWGWMTFLLHSYAYLLVAATLLLSALILSKIVGKKVFLFLLFLFAFNIGLMLLYATFYDYQAQGRYLFPSLYLCAGIVTMILIAHTVSNKILWTALIMLNLYNIYFSASLAFQHYWEQSFPHPLQAHLQTLPSIKDAQFHIDQLQTKNHTLFIKGWGFDPLTASPFKKIALVLRKNDKVLLVRAHAQRRPDVASFFHNNRLLYSGFAAFAPQMKPLSGHTFRCYLLVDTNRTQSLIDINRTVTINHLKR